MVLTPLRAPWPQSVTLQLTTTRGTIWQRSDAGCHRGPRSQAPLKRSEFATDHPSRHAVHHRLLERAIACGGTCTGEHGVGVGKKAYLERQHGAGALGAMRAVKRALDPLNILNPDKVVDLHD